MFSKTTKSFAALLVGAALINGCSKEERNEIADNIDEGVTELRLNDQWAKPCGNVILDVFGLSSSVVEFDFGASLSRTTTFFAEDNCANPVIAVQEKGDYSVGNEVASGARTLDLNYKTVTITPVTEEGRVKLDSINFCGIKDWAVGVARDVTAASQDNPACWTSTPRDLYDVVKVDGDRMMLGLEEVGRDRNSPEDRPTEVDQAVVYSRK